LVFLIEKVFYYAGFDPVICCLTTFNCNPNLVNHAGKMAVHYLAMKGHWQAIEDIATIGGYLDHPDFTGKIPLWYAVVHCRDAAVKSLLRSNCSPDPPVHISPFITENQFEEAGNRLDEAESPAQRVPIHAALEKKFYGIAQQLILAGCIVVPLNTVVTQYYAEGGVTGRVRVTAEEAAREREAMQWFSDWLSSPPTLKQTCRVRIRDCMRPAAAMHGVMGTLTSHLPTALRGYVNLSELDEFTREGIFY